MSQFAHKLVGVCLSFLIAGMFFPAQGQSVFDPNDPIVVYNPANPPLEPAFGTVAKWVKKNRVNFNTSSFKSYIYKGIPFRLKWPKNYDASGNTKYPLFVFFHGRGEWGTLYDNEYQLYHGGQMHRDAVDNGKFNGFLLYPQSTDANNTWESEKRQYVKELVENFLIPEVHVDPFRISVDGLSAGGFASWKFFESYPKLVAACLPISNASSVFNSIITDNKFTPIWLFQGALDQNPSPISAQYLKSVADNAGANFTYTEYPNLGHGSWYAAWSEPDYFPYLSRANKANPWPLYGRTEFCNTGPGSINTTIGVSAGFDQYEWRKNGVLLTGLGNTSNTLTITDIGIYDCRIRKGATWSDWSPIPVEIKYKTGTVPPTITVGGLASNVLPSLDGKTTVTLAVPSNYMTYKWEKVGNTTTLSSTNTLNNVGIGSYKVQVTEQVGCASAFSDPFTVVNANGPNKPDAPTNLIAIPLSFTSLKLNWSSNPSPVYPQTHFEIYQATQSGGPYQFVSLVNPDVFSFVKEGLTPGVKYYYLIRAVNNTAASAPSNEASATTQKDANPPTAPGNLHVTGTTRNYVSLAWDESTDDVGLDHYEVYVNGVKSYVTTETEYTVYGLVYGNSYNLTVKALDIAGNKSAPSNQVTAQPLAKGLTFKHYTGTWDNLPDFNLLTPISNGVVPNVTLANASQAENYGFLWEGYIRIPTSDYYVFSTSSDDGSKMYLSTYSHTGTAIVNNDGLHSNTPVSSSSMYLNAGVYPIAITYFQKGGGASMSISWKKTNGGGWSGTLSPIPDSAFVDPPQPPAGTAPSKPTNLNAAAVSFKQINLSWNDNSNDEKSFELYRSTDPLGGFVTIAVLPANTTSFSDSLVASATTYYYKIRAINQYGESAFDKSGPGISYAYYEKTGMGAVPDFNTMTPLKTGRVNAIELGMQMRQDNFAVKFDGFINIINTGTYTFYLQSDDGSLLYIDNNLVVNNDGLHGAANEIPGQVALSAGVHAIRVGFFEATGAESIVVRYEGPGVSKQTLPGSVLGDLFASATTLNAPPAPAPPSGLTAVGVNKSTIKVAWVNNAVNATGIELYRSFNGNSDYVLLATLPPATTSFNDKDLYPSSLFFYKVRSVGDGGSSSYSNEDDARTLGVVPAVVPIENVYMRYGSTLLLNVEATSGSPVVINLQVSNLPAFAVFNQTGNGKGTITFSPLISDAGVYNNISVTASNPDGDMNTAQFKLTVNDNYVPDIAPIPNATVQETATLQINLSATDNDAGDQLAWNFGGLPKFTTTISASNRSAMLAFAPKNGDEGEYRITAFANDGRNGKDTASFILKVTHADVVDPNDGTVPVKPKDLSGVFVNSLNAVKLTWTNMAYNAVRNEVYRSSSRTGGYVLLNPGANNKNDTSYVDNSVSGNHTYYYLVRAVNDNGGSNSFIVQVIIPNRGPVISLDDIFAKSGNSKTVNVIATDDLGDLITLSASNLPPFVTFTDNGGGNGVMQLSPTGSHIGTYEGVSIQAKDQHGTISSKTIKITVTDKYISSVYVNFNNKDYPISFMPWNSFNATQAIAVQVPANTTLSNLKDETGVTTPLGVKLLQSWPQTNNGVVTGNNSGVFPDSVMMTGYNFTVTASRPSKTIRIFGLSDNKQYNLVFFNSRVNTGASTGTHFTAGGITVSLDPLGNSSFTAKINGLTANQDGEIDVVVNADLNKLAAINAMVIQEYDEGIILPPTNLNMSGSTRNSISLSWKSNTTNVTGFEVWRSNTPNGTYSKLPGSIPGNVFTFTDAGLQGGTVYYYKVRAVAGSEYSDFTDYLGAATIKYAVNIKFNDGIAPQPAPWNNTDLLYNGYKLANLVNDDNQYTGINLSVVSNFSGFNNWGMTTGNNSGPVPDNVMKEFYYSLYAESAQLMIDGLSFGDRYNFVFFASCDNRLGIPLLSEYSIGGKSVSINAVTNSHNTSQINDLEPSSYGRVSITLKTTAPGGIAILNSISINAVPSINGSGGGQSPRRKSANNSNENTSSVSDVVLNSGMDESNKESLKVFPVPIVDDIMVQLSLRAPVDKLEVALLDVAGHSIFDQELRGLVKGRNERKLNTNARKIAPGIYFLRISGWKDQTTKVIKIVKR